MSTALARMGTIKMAKKRTAAALAYAEATKAAKSAKSRYRVSAPEQRTIDGIVFDSKKEARRYAELRLMEKAGTIRDLQPQLALKVKIGGDHYCTYTCDFFYVDSATGASVYEETKSTGTRKDAAYRLRRKAAELYHGVRIVEVMR